MINKNSLFVLNEMPNTVHNFNSYFSFAQNEIRNKDNAHLFEQASNQGVKQ